MVDKKMPEPMDSGAPERDVAEPVSTHRRACYAVVTLTGEVLHLFPEAVYQVSNYNGRDVGLSVEFLADQDLADLLSLLGDPAHNADPRISQVIRDGDAVTISFHNRPRTYDLRDTFGLAEAWSILDDEWDGGSAAQTSDDVQDGGGA